jgi:hypothetical protein
MYRGVHTLSLVHWQSKVVVVDYHHGEVTYPDFGVFEGPVTKLFQHQAQFGVGPVLEWGQSHISTGTRHSGFKLLQQGLICSDLGPHPLNRSINLHNEFLKKVNWTVLLCVSAYEKLSTNNSGTMTGTVTMTRRSKYAMGQGRVFLLLYEDYVWVSLGNAMKAKQSMQ